MAPNSRASCNRQHERSQFIRVSLVDDRLPTRERQSAARLAVPPQLFSDTKTTLSQLQTTTRPPGRLSSTSTADFSPSPSLSSGQSRTESIGRARVKGKFDLTSVPSNGGHDQSLGPHPLFLPSFLPSFLSPSLSCFSGALLAHVAVLQE
ncbi:hypothetical protein ASPBRDRAFT_345021 [Aspergillus brasiliensis CBS 101740]|uniref:Uncharacterized protein n=1 Tax=Aspergillus brasiliensis (strain CBS 101740 / IMI 381727 / IBT 21946) TaxID=767769 RepID=A0A1L9U767_ASPBC|nr:hypothetical protein ASPBRDRAFT_345021 [Aspergillus brasiliensis CBS 101740]